MNPGFSHLREIHNLLLMCRFLHCWRKLEYQEDAFVQTSHRKNSSWDLNQGPSCYEETVVIDFPQFYCLLKHPTSNFKHLAYTCMSKFDYVLQSITVFVKNVYRQW